MVIINIIINLKDHRLNSGSDSRPIIGSDFGANITSQYRPAIIIQASIDHRSNIDIQHWLPILRAWADLQPDHIFLHWLIVQPPLNSFTRGSTFYAYNAYKLLEVN